jgi:hypothetical protein
VGLDERPDISLCMAYNLKNSKGKLNSHKKHGENLGCKFMFYNTGTWLG